MGKTGKKQTEKKRLKCEYVQASGTYTFSAHLWPLPYGDVSSTQVNPGEADTASPGPSFGPYLDQLP